MDTSLTCVGYAQTETSRLSERRNETYLRLGGGGRGGVVAQKDYTQRAYFVTGKLDAALYDPDCTFEDPTIAFSGVALWRRNLALLTPFLVAPRVRLLSLAAEQQEPEPESGGGGGGGTVRARWTLTCGLRLPWRPLVDLEGETDYHLGGGEGEEERLMIVRHTERWSITGAQALIQIVTPAAARVREHARRVAAEEEGSGSPPGAESP